MMRLDRPYSAVQRTALILSFTAACAAVYLVLRVSSSDPLSRIALRFRPTEARLSVFRHAPYREMRLGESDREGVAEAMPELMKRMQSERSASNLQRLGVAQLAAGKTRTATALLAEASSLDPDNAVILSDRAASDLASGNVFDAAERSARAMQLDPEYRPAAFNWALSLEHLWNSEAAIEGWERYLRLDPSSEWSAEAMQHLAHLRRPRPQWKDDQRVLRQANDPAVIRRLVERYPGRVRAWVETELLPAWIERGDASDLRLLRAIVAARAATGDPFLADVVEHATSSREQIRSAFAVYAAANQAMKDQQVDVAAGKFSDAAQQFQRAGSPMAFIADLGVATQDFYRGRSSEALALLDTVDQRLASIGNRYPTIAAESGWSRGLVLGRLGEWNESRHACETALQAARRAGESEDVVAIGGLVVAILDRFAEPAEAEKARIDLLRSLYETGVDRTYVIYAETTWAALQAGRPRLALAFIEPQRTIAARTKIALYRAESESKRALALRDLGRIAEAVVAAEDARAAAMSIGTAGLRDRSLAQIEYIRGTLDAEARPHSAVRSYTAAMAIWDRYGWRLHSVTARTKRGQSYLAAGDRKAAEADFLAAIEQIEHERGALDEPQLRIAYFERADQVFERLIGLLLAEKRTEEALSIAERKRARALLDQIVSRTGDTIHAATPLSAEAIAAKLDPATILIQTALLDSGAAIWVVRRSGVSFVRSPADRQAIEGAVRRHVAAIAANNVSAMRREGRWLFDQLIAPIASSLAPSSRLVFVPDGALQTLPFAALVMPDGRYLVEQHTIAVAPSATIFVSFADSMRTPTSVLAVAQPAPPGMDYLPNAEREAKDSANLYPRGRTFTGPEITPSEFLAGARIVDVVCFAGHARVDASQPSRSALLFEPRSEKDPSELTAAAIAASDLPTRPLVILGACRTGLGRMRRNEGVDSLATAFLYAGGRGVVATLWDVEDRASADLFQYLHRNLRAGARPADALRAAQLSMLRGDPIANRSPASWASAVFVGSL
jgi:CHAT domain-containing protein